MGRGHRSSPETSLRQCLYQRQKESEPLQKYRKLREQLYIKQPICSPFRKCRNLETKVGIVRDSAPLQYRTQEEESV